jgi:hypothetical protein
VWERLWLATRVFRGCSAEGLSVEAKFLPLATTVMLILLTSPFRKTTIRINQKQSHEFWEDL